MLALDTFIRSSRYRSISENIEGEAYFSGADLVDKRADYAEIGIAEYWIANPLGQTVTILRLDGKQYSEHGVFQRGATATSLLLA